MSELVTCLKCDLVILVRDLAHSGGKIQYTCPECGFTGVIDEPFGVNSDGTLRLEEKE